MCGAWFYYAPAENDHDVCDDLIGCATLGLDRHSEPFVRGVALSGQPLCNRERVTLP